ncbi:MULTISPECIES: hypothetical protein [unclassified Brevibacterium]|uniref:hypothetical protein n=1 Tax=unclassified Brevibacterium TaxID=2614124 RepID=UPI00196B3B8B|nr:hypothetical protein [Brevibacterium sp. S111]
MPRAPCLLPETHDSDHHPHQCHDEDGSGEVEGDPAALMLDQFGLAAEADRVGRATENATGAGILLRGPGGESNTVEMTEAIVAQLEAINAEETVAA